MATLIANGHACFFGCVVFISTPSPFEADPQLIVIDRGWAFAVVATENAMPAMPILIRRKKSVLRISVNF
ncbi:hypothetical protein [Collimonas humicola]|uniref:hypothetical protein n=1 Tax=Collimonas humicola TaxID=2825886 RepID=UPI001B8BECF6|nr:hypothetical protein [Collimonas humicola]